MAIRYNKSHLLSYKKVLPYIKTVLLSEYRFLSKYCAAGLEVEG